MAADRFDEGTLRAAHASSIFHRAALEASGICGCFQCLRNFAPGQIGEWTDDNRPRAEWTALCPFCGIDAVIGDASGFTPETAFLTAMNRYWFDEGDEEE